MRVVCFRCLIIAICLGLGSAAIAQQVVLQQRVAVMGNAPPVKPTNNETQQQADLRILNDAGLKDAAPEVLIAYLKDRTLTGVALVKIQTLIKDFAWNKPFPTRMAAQETLLKVGGPAMAPLKLNTTNDDAEIAFRSKETIRRMEREKSISSEVTTSVIRSLGRVNSAVATEALFAFLPLADTPLIIDEIQRASTANAGTGNTPNPTFVKALEDERPLVRRVAAIALASGGNEGQRVRFKTVHPKLIELAKTDKDVALRFELARILLIESREKQAVVMLINTLPEATRGQSWVVEELLVQLAGKDGPKERCSHVKNENDGKEPEANKKKREKVRDAWKKWWEANGEKMDITKLPIKQTLQGELVTIWQGWNGQSQLQFQVYGVDDKPKLRFGGERMNFGGNGMNFMDMAYLENGHSLTLDTNVSNLTERDINGKVVATRVIPADKKVPNFQGKSVKVLPNGNLFVVHVQGFVELDKDFKEVARYTRPNLNNVPQLDIQGACRMTDGRTAVVLTSNRLITLDDKFKEDKERKGINVLPAEGRQNITQCGEDRVLVLEQSQIAEYNLKTGKAEETKFKDIYNASAMQRLPNGNVLYIDQNNYPQSIVEKSATGEVLYQRRTGDTNGNYLKALVK